MSNIIPYDWNREKLAPTIPTAPGHFQGVHIVMSPENCDPMYAQFGRWFAGRHEVIFVDHGDSDKLGNGYIILEWDGCQIDQLFLAQLRDTDVIIDYTVYERTEV